MSCDNTTDNNSKGRATLSKKRYEELYNEFSQKCPAHVDELMETIRRVMKFDPSQNTYDEKQGQRIKSLRDRKKAEGVSTYVSTGQKQMYWRKKELKNI